MTQVVSAPFTVQISASPYAGYTDGQGLTSRIMLGTQYDSPSSNEPYWRSLSFSGICLNSEAGKLYFFGGGHNDGFDNSVFELPMDSPAKENWVRHMGATVDLTTPVQSYGSSTPEQIAYIAAMDADGAKERYAGGLFSKQRPIPRHTYYQNCWIPSVGKMLARGGSYADEYMWNWEAGHYGNGWGDQWLYDPSVALASRWEHIGHPTSTFAGLNRSAWTMARAGIVDYDFPMWVASLGKVVAIGGPGISVQAFDPAAKTWAVFANSRFALPYTITKAVYCYDSNRHSIFMLGGNHGTIDYNAAAPVSVFEYPLATAGQPNNWVYRPTTGGQPVVETGNGDGCVFSTWSNSPLLYSRTDSQKFWRLNTSTWVWSVLATGAFADAGQAYAMRWCPLRNVGFHLVGSGISGTQSTNLYVFRA